MSLHNIAQHLANQGRGKDTTLVHMTPNEVSGLAALAHANGKEISVNPQTGLPEAGALEGILAGLALNYIAPGFGGAIGEMLGLGSAAGTGLAVGAGTAAITGNIGKGFEAGFGAYTGAGLGESLAGLGMGELGREASSSAVADATAQKLEGDAYNKAVQDSVTNRMASATMADKYGAGLNFAGNNPGTAFKATAKYLAPAALSIFADKGVNDVQTTTPQQKPNPGVYHPFTYDPYAQTMTPGQRYTAANGGLMSLAHGGAVRRFDEGGMSIDDAYRSVLGREPDAAGRAYWSQANIFGDKVDDTELAAFRQSALGGTDTADKTAAQSFGAPASTTGQGFAAAAPPAPVAQNFGKQGDIGNNLMKMAPVEDARADEAAFTAARNAANNAGIAALANTTGAGNTDYIPISQLDNLYMQELSRHGEYGTDGKEGGMEFWKRTFGDYIDPTELAGFRKEAAKELAAREKATRPDVVTDLTTADTAYVKPGVGGPTGAGQEGGGTVVNPNGTITTSPRIPGIPVGGFTGMDQVRDTYTKGGGKLGILPNYVPKDIDAFNAKYKNTGDSKAMYDYLMGKGSYPTGPSFDVDPITKEKVYKEPSKVYSEVMGGPVNSNKQYTWNPAKGEYFRNPDYVRQEKIVDPTTKERSLINYMSINQAKAALKKDPLEGNALAEWSIDNFVDPATLAEATGMTINQINALLAKAKQDKAFSKKEGGLMSLAKGGLANGGLPEKERTNSVTGVKYYFDFANGIYRPETTVKDGITYKWNPVTNKYETTSASGTGIASLVEGGGPPAGGENAPKTTPDWGTAFQIGKTLSDMGLTTVGGYIQGAATNGILGQSNSAARTADALPATTTDLSQGYDTAASRGGRGAFDPYAGDSAKDAGRTVGQGSGTFSSSNAVDTGVSSDPTGGDLSGPADGTPFAYGGMAGYAQGGLGSLGGYSDGGRLLRGPGDGVSDSIPASIGNKQPARLADGEFVVPARIVSELGNGSTEAGARALYKMMARIQANRRKTTGKNSVAVDSKSHKYLPA